MSSTLFLPRIRKTALVAAMLCTVFLASVALAEECKMGSDLDPATKQALQSTALNYFQMAASGNATELQQNSIPAVANDFGSIQQAISDHKADFGSNPTVRNVYELDAPGNGPIQRAEFYCGIFNSPDRVAFAINNLPAGRYALVILQANGGKVPMTVSMVLQQYASGAWKLGGFYARPSSLAGHDAQWYVDQAAQYKAAGKNYNAWMYYLAAWDLEAPVPFMSTAVLDKLSEDMQSARPADLPSPQQPLTLTSGSNTYKVTQIFAVPVQDGLGLVVKFQVPYDVADTAKAYADNMEVMKAILARFPQFREAFSSIVARAVAPSGQDYGTLLAMKDVK